MEHNCPNYIATLPHPGCSQRPSARSPRDMDLANEGENTWSPFDVVGHLIHAERADWVPRIKTIMQFGESQAFDLLIAKGTRRGSRQVAGAAIG